jgi:hypothetical protein
MTLPIRSLIAAAVVAAATPTLAATAVHIEAGGPGFLSFNIAEQPTPTAFVPGSSFTLTNVKGVFNGVSGKRTIDFFNNSLGGGFQVVGGPGINSQQIYISGEGNPFIESGDYFATDRASGANVGLIIFQNGTVGSVPEPTVWMLMIGGFGLVGVGLRRWQLVATA